MSLSAWYQKTLNVYPQFTPGPKNPQKPQKPQKSGPENPQKPPARTPDLGKAPGQKGF